MRKILIFIALVSINFAFAQNFPGKDVDLLLNKTIRPKVYDKSEQQYHYRNFYAKFDTTTGLQRFKNQPFPDKKGIYSQYDSLA